MSPKEYIRKNVPFDPMNEEEKKLYEWLQTLPHGQFAERTKAFWLEQMKNIHHEEDVNFLSKQIWNGFEKSKKQMKKEKENGK